MMTWLKKLWVDLTAERPCTCHACMGYEVGKLPPNVRRSLHLWVGKDGQFHWRVKSSVQGDF